MFSPDGRRLLSQFGESATLWNMDLIKEVGTINPFATHMHCLAFAGNGRRFLVGGETLEGAFVDVWDLETGRRLQRFGQHKPVGASARFTSVVLSFDGQRAASANADGVRLWDVETGRQLIYWDRPTIQSLAFSPDGRFLVLGGGLGALTLWDLQTGREMRRFEGPGGGIFCLTFSPDGRYVLSGGADGSVRLWDLESGKETHRFAGHSAEVRSVAFSADGRAAVSGSQDKTVRVWNVAKYIEIPK